MEDRDITLNRKLYELDAQYKSDSNLIKYINEAQNFYNGDQYPNANFNNMIRVTLNICSFSAQIKASKICGTPIYLTFTADNLETDCTALRQFDEYNCNKMHLKDINYQSALNGFVNGTEITYLRWDEDDTSYKGIYKGGLVAEHIDLRNFAVANPYIHDIQNQQWVMFWEDYPVSVLKEMCEASSKAELKKKREAIEREMGMGDEDDYKRKEFINHSLCTLYTRFFRVDGEVYFMCSTRKVDIFEYPHALSKTVNKSIIKKVIEKYNQIIKKDGISKDGDPIVDYETDSEDTDIASIKKETLEEGEYKKIKEKFSLYPFAVFRPFAINRSFYGRSDIKTLIPIQKGLNFAISMVLKCAENNAYNKILAKPEALQGQEITNEPSQVLIDYSNFSNQWGIKFAESQPMPNGVLDFADRLLGMTRTIYGFNDVMDGSVNNQNLSGYAVQQMIEQANSSIEQQQQLFWLYNEDMASIRLMFYKHYVDSARYTTELTDAEYEGEEQARQLMQSALMSGAQFQQYPEARAEDFAKPVHKTKVKEIFKKDIYGINFDISVDAMQGLNDSKLIEQQTWDNLLLNNGISQLPPENLNLYLQCAPNISPRTKASLKNVVKNLEMSKVRNLENQLKETIQKTQQIVEYTKQLEARLGYESKYINNLTSEFTGKINSQNKIIEGLSNDLDKYRGDEGQTEGQVKSENARGIKGNKVEKA